MIESITVVTLCIIFLVYFRPGKTPPLENQLIIERPGKYKMILAPKLNLAQPFIEAVIERISRSNDATIRENAIQYAAVRDKQVVTKNGNTYLLAIIYREGMLYCIAEHPSSNNPCNYLETIKACSSELIKEYPTGDEQISDLGESIISALKNVSEERGVSVELL